MAEPQKSLIGQGIDDALTACRGGWHVIRTRGPSQVQFWFIALLVGIAASFAAIGFRFGIETFQAWLYQTDDVAHLRSDAARLDWWWILLIPMAGGLAVGVILNKFTDDGRVRSVADVIEGAALYDGRVEWRKGLVSSLASFITLSTGGSTGREGPVVHLAAIVSTYVSRLIRADGITGRDLMGCAVAAAVSASFNAPIAGALFALEVVLRHFAVHAFAPIVIASVAGTVINRSVYGDVTEFLIPNQNILAFYVELPAFLILGLLCGLIAVVLMRAIFYPHIIGVGYETTSDALTGRLVMHEAIVFVFIKIVAVAITMAGRMGGGVFSPSLMVGAMTGLAFGIVATGIFPDVSGEGTLYALAGMGAVTAAVLGAPISTTLIVFELTGDWQTGIAVMVSVSLSSALASKLVHRSFFLTQLERRGVHLAAGPQAYLLGTFKVASVMRTADHPKAADPETCAALILEGMYISQDMMLDQAMPILEATGSSFIPVVIPAVGDGPPELRGALFQVDVLRAFNRALAATAAEEHS
jgi:CIC family chloride channel protein